MRLPALALVLAFFLVGCFRAPLVVQGTVQSYDADSRSLVVVQDDSLGRTLTISLEGAEIGAEPQPGDTVRVAYHDRDGRLVATRVMNITRQAEIAGTKKPR
jgi:hypothetical protein